MPVNFKVAFSDSTGTFGSFKSLIIENTLAAAAQWGSYINSNSGIEINVIVQDVPSNRADGASVTSSFIGSVNGYNTFEQGAAYEIRTGIDPNGAQADINIRVDPDYINQSLWFDQNPFDKNKLVPASKVDAESMFVHEIGHALAFNGWRDLNSGRLPADYQSTFDNLVKVDGGVQYFTGKAAQDAYGGPVPLTVGNSMHYGNLSGPGSDLVSNGLMNGVYFYGGKSYSISKLDLAILKDLGLPLDALSGVNIFGTAGNDVISTKSTVAGQPTATKYADSIFGYGGNDVIDGGSGGDVMTGGTGNDIYSVDNAGDRVFETVRQGTDSVVSTVSYTLAAGQEVETLQLARSTGTLSLSLTGNEFANTLRGNGGANTLDGKGGADTLYGGAGNDTYGVEGTADKVFEAAGAGLDKVVAFRSFALDTGQEIETLQFAGATGNASFNLAGNEFGQALFGNGGANVLFGKLGNDTLTGRAGADTFVFDTRPGTGNIDHITDFSVVDDSLRLVESVFTALAPGALAESAFKNISAGQNDADDRILYRQATGELYYDADGSGSARATLVAVIDTKAALTHHDFVIV